MGGKIVGWYLAVEGSVCCRKSRCVGRANQLSVPIREGDSLTSLHCLYCFEPLVDKAAA